VIPRTSCTESIFESAKRLRTANPLMQRVATSYHSFQTPPVTGSTHWARMQVVALQFFLASLEGDEQTVRDLAKISDDSTPILTEEGEAQERSRK
jgi:hypothetical protein